jgi:NAD(P)-dependent dehydrogenase (short-subunit alcohol dehydrogenase family)
MTQIVIVSGGSSGIGEACVNKFLQHDYFVYNFDIVESAKSNTNYKWLKTDVRNHQEIKNSIGVVIEEKARIDVVVASAGKHLSANVENTNDDQLIDLFQLNLFGCFWLIQGSLQYMKEQLKGNIITIGSDQSSIAKCNSSAYGMTKSAIASLTKSTALDYAKYNIRVNCIGAGTIDTPLYRAAIGKYAEQTGISLNQIEKLEAIEQPIGRIGKSEEVAELVYFLAQDSASFITGALIPLDGGYVAK